MSTMLLPAVMAMQAITLALTVLLVHGWPPQRKRRRR